MSGNIGVKLPMTSAQQNPAAVWTQSQRLEKLLSVEPGTEWNTFHLCWTGIEK